MPTTATVHTRDRGITDAQRNRMVTHAITICRLLAEHERTLNELSEEMGFGPRTVRRYIRALRDAGVDISISGLDDESDFRDPGEPIPLRYRLDHRAWSALLWLPLDGAR